MRTLLSPRACAILSFALSATAVTQNLFAAGVAVYGGPTYSDAAGGYRVTPATTGNSTAPPGIRFFPPFFGAVNDAGVAVGNVLRVDSPISTTAQPAYPSVAQWSSTIAPTFLDTPSPNVAIFSRGINSAGIVIGGADPTFTCQLTSAG